jgi:N-acyl homoserine lactone hydrolase
VVDESERFLAQADGGGRCASARRPLRNELLAEGERMPVYVHVIDHPDARVLVDTGMTELHPTVADLDPRRRPLSKQGVGHHAAAVWAPG